MVCLAAELDRLCISINNQFLAACNAAGTHTTCNDCSVACHTAACCENTLSSLHTLDIFRRSLETDKNNLLTLGSSSLRVLSCEDDLAGSSARSSRETLANHSCVLDSFLAEGAVKQCVEVTRLDVKDSLLLIDLAFLDEVIRDLQSSTSCSLAVTALKHIQFAMLDRELHILHISVVIFELVGNSNELFVDLRKSLLDLFDLHRCAGTGDDILALRVHKNLCVELILACSRVAGESNTRAGIISHVTECHHLNVNSSTPGVRDIVVTAINVRTRVVP